MELMDLGFVLVLIGMVLIVISAITGNGEYGGVVLIGPIPVVFGNSKRIILASLLATVLILLIALLLYR